MKEGEKNHPLFSLTAKWNRPGRNRLWWVKESSLESWFKSRRVTFTFHCLHSALTLFYNKHGLTLWLWASHSWIMGPIENKIR
jgi:hypothetical protein